MVLARVIGAAAAAVIALSQVWPSTPLAATPKAGGATRSLPGASWSAIASLPDFSGAWYLKTGGQFSRGGVAGALPPELTPAGTAELKKADHDYFDEGVNPPLQNCHPDGMPHIMDYAFPMEFYFTPGKITIYLEAYGQVRWIHTDGRKHSEDLPPTYNGESVGRWEGRTLVVDTLGMLPQTQLVISNNFLGIRHSDKLHIVERMRLIGRDLLEVRTTVDDPVIFARPWVTVKTYARRRDALHEVREYVCENNHEPLDANGKQIFLQKVPGQ
jgi:hypothetical protein